MTPAQVAIPALEEKRREAMIGGDLATLDNLLDDQLLFTHANGAVDDKSAYLAKVSSGRIVYACIEGSEQSIVDLGHVALMAGRMSTTVRVDGLDKRLENRILTVWIHRDDWRLVAFQSTPLASA